MTSAGSGRPEILTPRARALLPVFLATLIGLAVYQLWYTLPDRVGLSGPTMGTTWAVVLGGEGHTRNDLLAARERITAELDRVNGLMSTWDPDSELSRLNAHAAPSPFALSPDTLDVLDLARQVSEWTGGAFDITVGPLVAAWGFGAGARIPGEGPDAAELAALRERVGYRMLALDLEARTATKARPDLRCDLSAIAKGYGTDAVARALDELGWENYLVEVGGEVRVRGQRPGGGPWQVGIERPEEGDRVAQGVVPLSDLALATSGDYRNFYEVGGERRSHIVDPRTGRPVAHALASVSVVHAQAVLADAWATALTVLGPEEGLALAEEHGLGAYFLVRTEGDGLEAHATSGFPGFLETAVGDASEAE
ncbi:MAG: FAD:protein FMN transferase [Proteobacteria bacterium]|nr:FAD:protein FMN transferase [Pseudomonadota bacterium]